MRIRTFIAFDIESFALNELIKIRNELFHNYDLYFENIGKLHITIKFIGDIEEKETPKLIGALQNIADSSYSFKLSFTKFGFFFKNDLSSIFWAGISESNELLELRDKIENKLFEIGVEKNDKKYKPHLTLLRLKKNDNIANIKLILNKEISNIKFRVSHFSLIKSELKMSGSEYKIIKKYNLKLGS